MDQMDPAAMIALFIDLGTAQTSTRVSATAYLYGTRLTIAYYLGLTMSVCHWWVT